MTSTARLAAPRARTVIAIREILVATDLSAQSEVALRHACLLAERFDARLTLYHALEVPGGRYGPWASADGDEVWEHAADGARELLARLAKTVEAAHQMVVERASSAGSAIVSRIRATRPDLTVMATHGREGLSHLLLGSVTEAVIREVLGPILCVRDAQHGGSLRYRRIVVPTDFSLPSRLAFPMAAQMARRFGAEVVALHALSEPPHAGSVIPTEATLWKFMQQDFADLEVTAQVHRGRVWESIVHAARLEKADLIVMATRGRDTFLDRLIGSNTERVVRRAPCPVLVA